MRWMRRVIMVIVCATLAIVALSPLGLYWLGLRHVEGRPQKPMQLVTEAQKALVWKQARGAGKPHIDASNPYSYVAMILAEEGKTHPDQLVTSWVASDYLSGHRQRMLWWHLSEAALSIWLSRNWTSDEILSAAFVSPRLRLTAAHCDKLQPAKPACR